MAEVWRSQKIEFSISCFLMTSIAQFQSRLILIHSIFPTVPLRHPDSKNRNVTFAAKDLSVAYSSFAEKENRNHLKDGRITEYSRKYIAV